MGQEEKTMAKYCTKCGRKLEEGEVCNCTSQSVGSSAGLQLIIAKAVIFFVVMLIALLVMSGQINEMSYGFVTINMPYFQLILLTLLLTAGVDLLEAVLLKTITGAFNGVTNVRTMFNVIGARCIYDTIIFLFVIISGLLSWKAAFVVLFFATPISLYIQFSAYQGCVRMNENRKPYAYFLTKLCMSVISFLVIYVIIRSYISSIMSYMFSGIL